MLDGDNLTDDDEDGGQDNKITIIIVIKHGECIVPVSTKCVT